MPSCSCIIWRDSARPMPLPFFLVEKNGKNIFSICDCGISGPLFVMVMCGTPPGADANTVICPSGTPSIASMALRMMLIKANGNKEASA